MKVLMDLMEIEENKLVMLENKLVMHYFHHDHLENMLEMLDCMLVMLDCMKVSMDLKEIEENKLEMLDCMLEMSDCRMDLLVCMKDLMVNMMDFEENILMMVNILVMGHELNNQVMKVNNVDLMENNQVMMENILDLLENRMEMMGNNSGWWDCILVMYDNFLDLHQFDYLMLDFELNMLVMLENMIDLVNMMVMLDCMKDLLENKMVMLNLVLLHFHCKLDLLQDYMTDLLDYNEVIYVHKYHSMNILVMLENNLVNWENKMVK
jgi:hypothetical protein